MSSHQSQISNREWVVPAVVPAALALILIDNEAEVAWHSATDDDMSGHVFKKKPFRKHHLIRRSSISEGLASEASISEGLASEEWGVSSASDNPLLNLSEMFAEVFSTDNWVEIAAGEDWRSTLSERIQYLSRKEDGWKGEESVGPSPQARDEALEFLKKLSVENIAIPPHVGLDYEGAYAFCWSDEDFVTDLSIYGDGTYSYFAKRGGRIATSDEALISKPIDSGLRNLLVA